MANTIKQQVRDLKAKTFPMDLAYQSLNVRLKGCTVRLANTGGGIMVVLATDDTGATASVFLDPMGDGTAASGFCVTRHASTDAFWACDRECPSADGVALADLTSAITDVAVCTGGDA